MVNPLISIVFIIGIVIAAVTITLTLGNPIIDVTKDGVKLKQAEDALSLIDKKISEVMAEGRGSSRQVQILTPDTLTISADEDAVQYRLETQAEIFPYLSRSFDKNIARISESDVNCRKENNLIAENSFVRFEFQSVEKTSPLPLIDTKGNIKSIKEKIKGTVLFPEDTSVMIDNVTETAAGTGYTEVLKEGTLPVCTVHVFVNSTVSYDIYYKLYSGADFVVMEVVNIR